MSAASSEQKSAVRTAALAALQAFQNEEPATTDEAQRYEAKLDAAISRAEEILALDTNAGLYGNLEAGTHFLEDTSGRISAGGSNLIGTISPGAFFAAEPSGGCGAYSDTAAACPCPGGSWVGQACFQANDGSTNQLTAIEINLSTPEEQRCLLYTSPSPRDS